MDGEGDSDKITVSRDGITPVWTVEDLSGQTFSWKLPTADAAIILVNQFVQTRLKKIPKDEEGYLHVHLVQTPDLATYKKGLSDLTLRSINVDMLTLPTTDANECKYRVERYIYCFLA